MSKGKDIWREVKEWRETERLRRTKAKKLFDAKMKRLMVDLELVVNKDISHINWKNYR